MFDVFAPHGGEVAPGKMDLVPVPEHDARPYRGLFDRPPETDLLERQLGIVEAIQIADARGAGKAGIDLEHERLAALEPELKVADAFDPQRLGQPDDTGAHDGIRAP